ELTAQHGDVRIERSLLSLGSDQLAFLVRRGMERVRGRVKADVTFALLDRLQKRGLTGLGHRRLFVGPFGRQVARCVEGKAIPLAYLVRIEQSAILRTSDVIAMLSAQV